jgi:hypothetical protein
MVKINIILVFLLFTLPIAIGQDQVEFQYFDKKMKLKVDSEKVFIYKLEQKSNGQIRSIRGRAASSRRFSPQGKIVSLNRRAKNDTEFVSPILIGNGEMEYIPNGKLIVQFNRNLSDQELSQWMKKFSVEFEDIISISNGDRYVFIYKPGFEVIDLVNLISIDSLVKEVAPDMVKNIMARKTPTESELNNRKRLLKLETGNQR